MIEKVVLNGEEHKLSPEYKDIRNKPSINGVELKEGDNKIEIIDINVDPDVDIVEEGKTPSVINTGTSKNPTLKFSLPKGDKGDTGKVYVPTVDEESGDLSWSLQDNTQDIDSTNIKGPQGERGIGLTVSANKVGKQTTVVITTDGSTPEQLETLQINDGNDGHNPCLGRFSSVQSTFVETPRAGDYYYVDVMTDDTTDPPTVETTIYKYNGTNWDEGTVVDVSNLTFATSEEVTNVAIDNTKLANPADNALAKAKDVAPIKLSLEDHYVTDVVVALSSGQVTEGEDENTYSGWSGPDVGVILYNGIWQTVGTYSHYIISLEQYKNAGYKKIYLKAKSDHVARYTFSKRAFTDADSYNDVSADLSSAMAHGYASLTAGEEKYIDIPSDAKYLYFIYRYGDTNDSWVPGTRNIIKEHLVNSIIPKVIDNLESEDTANSLSAKQGRVLKEDIGNLETKVFGGDIVSEYGATIDETTQCGAWFKADSYAFDGDNLRSRYAELDTESIGENTYLRITANITYDAHVTFLNSNSGITSNGTPVYSAIMGNKTRFDILHGESMDFKLASDMKYIVLFNKNKSGVGTDDGAFMPLKIQYVEKEVYEGVAATIPSGLEVASKPAPPKVYNLAINDGKLEESADTLITARVYGDFMCMVRDGYKITRVIRCDSNGTIVNERISSLYSGVYEAASGEHTKQQFGVVNQLPEYGVIIEVKKENNGTIYAEEEIWEWFMWGTEGLKSELNTSSRYNGETPDDSQRIYTHESIEAAVIRMKIGAMLVWQPLRYIMPTHAAWRDVQYKAGTIQYGVPYSRANLRERWALMDVSPYTFLTAIANPYSVIYTERIGRGTSSEDWKSATEYSINTNLYQSGHGIPYYGLVCSAYASYVYGFYTANQTASFPTDTGRNYVISKHREASGTGWTTNAVDALQIPALSVITTPGHSYIVMDFLLDANNQRIAAIVAEETEPNIKVGLYPIERLQERFNYEYNRYCIQKAKDPDISIEVTAIKPSVLDANKERLLWEVSDLYYTGTLKERMMGMCRKLIKPDPNVMFYMGDKAVVTTYDITNYTGNDKCWLIVKPDDIYTDIVVQRLYNGEWTNVGEPLGIESIKASYSDANTDYYKVDVTNLCSNAGKYRAYLTGEDESQTVQSGFTQWIVVDIEIGYDPSDATHVVWSVDNSHCDIGDDEYAEIVAVGRVYQDGGTAQGDDYAEESNAEKSFLNKSYFTDINGKCRVIAMTKWGAAHRDKNIS